MRLVAGHYGAFQRAFRMPIIVDQTNHERVEAQNLVARVWGPGRTDPAVPCETEGREGMSEV